MISRTVGQDLQGFGSSEPVLEAVPPALASRPANGQNAMSSRLSRSTLSRIPGLGAMHKTYPGRLHLTPSAEIAFGLRDSAASFLRSSASAVRICRGNRIHTPRTSSATAISNLTKHRTLAPSDPTQTAHHGSISLRPAALIASGQSR
jgi:hypothetical protein